MVRQIGGYYGEAATGITSSSQSYTSVLSLELCKEMHTKLQN